MKPRAFLLGRPQFDEAYLDFLAYVLPPEQAFWTKKGVATPAEWLIEFAGRVCYMSFGLQQSAKTTGEYIQNLIRNGHESVLEHAVWSFALVGISRAFTHQLVRHRVGFAFSQLSQQYHDESEARFVRPHGIDQVPEAASAWDHAMRDGRAAYRKILDALEQTNRFVPPAERREARRALRSAARSVLPNATETAIVVTANARALRHFFMVRGGIVGDAEMRYVGAALLDLVGPEAPAVFADFSIEFPGDGLPLLVHHPMK